MSSANFGYGCIIDAGSSGSRIYLYRWPNEGDDDGDGERSPPPSSSSSSYAEVEREAVFDDERSGGISSEGGLERLGELVAAAVSALPPGVDPADVPVHLGATAGMRLVASADAIMADVRSLLRGSGFRFRDEWARMISGDEESVYGWLVANYLRGRGLPGSGGDGDSGSAAYGALDLGGGSTQISCLASAPSRTPPPTATSGKDDNTFPLLVGDVKYLLYTRSYLHYGADRARERHDTQIVGDASRRSLGEKINPCYATGYVHPDTNISGSSNWDECFDSVTKLFVAHSNLRGGPEQAILDVIVPPPAVGDAQQQRYIAMSVFVFVWDFLGLRTGETTDDLKMLEEKARQICSLTHEQQTEQYDRTMKDKPPSRKTNKAFAQCFNAAYAYHLLSKGYKMPVADTPIEVYYEINGGKVNWALGMMLVEANNLHHGTGKGGSIKHRLNDNTYYGSNASKPLVFMAMLLLFCMLFRRSNGSDTVISLLRRRTSKGKK